MTSKLDNFTRRLALQLGAESVNIAAVLPNGDRLGTNLVLLPVDAPKLRALALRALAKHLRYCASRAERAAEAEEAQVQ